MKLTTEQCLEGAEEHGAVLTVTEIDSFWQGDGGAIFQKDQLTAYTNDMIEQATQELQNRVRELEEALNGIKQTALGWMPIHKDMDELMQQCIRSKDAAFTRLFTVLSTANKTLANTNPNSAELARRMKYFV